MDFTKEEKLLNAISKVYNEATIDDYPDLKEKLFLYSKEISEGKSVGEVSMKLSSFLGRYILKHKFGLPKSLIELQEIVSKESQVYRGWASIFTVYYTHIRDHETGAYIVIPNNK
ncbi:bacteriocin immunity protein [Enterococcus faecium]|uniref:bacteriocin immunity protein n=2 Tax=Enterococcus faecium TaxID=1352 RepID=UPI001F3E3B2B|nr:bacteriocin immunity protein [Enterococcus faecium]